MNEHNQHIIPWIPVALASLSAGFWAVKRVVSYGQRLAALEVAIESDRELRRKFVEEYKADRIRNAADSKSIIAVATKVDMILEELRKR